MTLRSLLKPTQRRAALYPLQRTPRTRPGAGHDVSDNEHFRCGIACVEAVFGSLRTM